MSAARAVTAARSLAMSNLIADMTDFLESLAVSGLLADEATNRAHELVEHSDALMSGRRQATP